MVEKRAADDSAEAPPSKKKWFAVAASIVSIVVGEERVEFLVHESVISRCPFFEKCLSAGMREQEERVIDLPEDDPEAISIVIDWLYDRDLGLDDNLDDYVLAYEAADKLCLPKLQNIIMDKLREELFTEQKTKLVSPGWVMFVWRHTSECSMLRTLALRHLHWCMLEAPLRYEPSTGEPTSDWSTELRELMDVGDFAHAFMWSIIKGPNRGRKGPADGPGCFFHLHAAGGRCPTPKSRLPSPKPLRQPHSLASSARQDWEYADFLDSD